MLWLVRRGQGCCWAADVCRCGGVGGGGGMCHQHHQEASGEGEQCRCWGMGHVGSTGMLVRRGGWKCFAAGVWQDGMTANPGQPSNACARLQSTSGHKLLLTHPLRLPHRSRRTAPSLWATTPSSSATCPAATRRHTAAARRRCRPALGTCRCARRMQRPAAPAATWARSTV